MTSTSYASSGKLAAAFLAVVLLFLVANRAAYKGYFSADDLDNIAWTRNAQPRTFAEGIATPRYIPQHFRPIGHALFHFLGKFAWLNYRWYVATLHALHFANIALLFVLLRQLDLQAWGALFFAFPMAVFDALWKPMYVFDVTCATFALLTLVTYISGRTLLSLVFFWLSCKSKELGAMLAFVLIAYELWIGGRNWKRTLPFLAISASFIVQSLISNRSGVGDDYRILLTAAAFRKTIGFYAPRVLLSPWLLAAFTAAALWTRDRRAAWGLSLSVLLIAPLLVLPGRIFSAYLYAPMIGIAIAASAILGRLPRRPLIPAALIAVWWAVNFQTMRIERRAALAEADQNRAYVAKVLELPTRFPAARRFFHDGSPPGMPWWGILGSLRLAYKNDDLRLDLASSGVIRPPAVVLSWNGDYGLLETAGLDENTPPRAFLRMNQPDSVFQLNAGWYPKEGPSRWSEPLASVRLWRPAGARRLEMEVAPPQDNEIAVIVGGEPAGSAKLRASQWQTIAFDLPPGDEGQVIVEWRVSPPHHPGHGDTRVLGVLVRGLGFVTKETK